MRYKFIIKIPLVVFLVPSLVSAKFMEVDTMDQVDMVTSTADHDTLVVFDIDNTLTIPANPAFQIPNVLENKPLLGEFKKNGVLIKNVSQQI